MSSPNKKKKKESDEKQLTVVIDLYTNDMKKRWGEGEKGRDGESKRQSMPVVLIKQWSVMKKRENARSVLNFK